MKKQTIFIIAVIVGILAIMSVYPTSDGQKTADADSINKLYTCTDVSDCPSCIGDFSSFEKKTMEPMSACTNGVCKLSDACIIWDCGAASEQGCKSQRQTILQATVGNINKNPAILLVGLAVLIISLLLYKK